MIVVDTNVIGGLYFPSERLEQVKRALQRDPSWVAPWLWRSEFCNALVLYVRKRWMTMAERKRAWTGRCVSCPAESVT